MSVLCQNNRTLRCSVQVKQEKSIRCRNQTAPGLKLLIGTTGRRSLQRRGNTTPRGLRRPVTNAAVFSHGHEVQPEENRELTILLEKYNIVLYLQRRREPAADWEVSSCCTSGATSPAHSYKMWFVLREPAGILPPDHHTSNSSRVSQAHGATPIFMEQSCSLSLEHFSEATAGFFVPGALMFTDISRRRWDVFQRCKKLGKRCLHEQKTTAVRHHQHEAGEEVWVENWNKHHKSSRGIQAACS